MHGYATSGLERWLDRLRMRSDLTDADVDTLRKLPFETREVSSNRDFVRMGEQTTHACLVVTGLVGRFGQTASGQRQITALAIPGDMVDLHSVVVPKASSALQALTATTILRVSHAALQEASEGSDTIARAFWRDCVADAMILAEWVQSVGRRDARGRLSHLLCELALRNGAIGNDPRAFPMAATQLQLADTTGLTSVHVNRTMRRLHADKVVDVVERQVRIHDWDALASAGDFNPNYLHLSPAVLDPLIERLKAG